MLYVLVTDLSESLSIITPLPSPEIKSWFIVISPVERVFNVSGSTVALLKLCKPLVVLEQGLQIDENTQFQLNHFL